MAKKIEMKEKLSLKLDDNYENSENRKNCSSGKHLSKPIFNSTLRHKTQIEQLKKMNIGSDISEADINKRKLTSKLNFGTHEKVFGDLPPINVNDSLLLPRTKVSIPEKYGQNNGKIPVPELKDFLEDIPPLEYVVKEPEIKLETIEYDFNVLLNYELLNG